MGDYCKSCRSISEALSNMPYDTLSRKIKWGRFLHWILFGQNWPYLLLIVSYFWVADSWTLSYCCCLVAKLCQNSFVTPRAVAFQAPLSMGFPRQEYWSRLPFPSPGDLLDPGIKPASPALAGRVFTLEPPGKPSWTPSSVQFSQSVMYDSLWPYGLQHEHLIVLMKVSLSVIPGARSKRGMVQA